MGLLSSKEQLMSKAIDNQDINAVKTLINELTREQMQKLCKAFVPGNTNQCTILHFATWQDNPQLLALLLDYVDDLEIRDGLDWTPLMAAVNRDSKENVKLLLKRGAKIDCDCNQGMDLIASAMSFDDIELVRILMEHGAKATSTSENQTGCYLLHFAIDDGLVDIAKLLVEKGKIPVNTLDQSGWSPLHLAAGHNFLNIVQFLIKNEADINIKDLHGNTPLAWAKEMNAEGVIKELEKHGAIADKEWHGAKLELNHYNQPTDAIQEKQGIDNYQFEIEGVEGKNTLKNKDFNILDALQRQ